MMRVGELGSDFMAFALEGCMTEPKRGRGRPSTGREDVSVKVNKDIASMAKALATMRGESVAVVLSEILRKPITKAYAAMVAKADEEDETT